MTQTKGRFFDEMGRLMNDAAGVAQGVRREFDTLFRTQAERILRELDVVSREEFEAVKEMARLAREENEKLKARITALELALNKSGQPSGPDGPARPRVPDRDGSSMRRSGSPDPLGRAVNHFRKCRLRITQTHALTGSRTTFCNFRWAGYKPAASRHRHPWRHAASHAAA